MRTVSYGPPSPMSYIRLTLGGATHGGTCDTVQNCGLKLASRVWGLPQSDLQGLLPYEVLPWAPQDKNATWACKCATVTKLYAPLRSLPKLLESVIYFHVSVFTFYSLCVCCKFCFPPSMPHRYSDGASLSRVTSDPKIKTAIGVFQSPHISFYTKMTTSFMPTR